LAQCHELLRKVLPLAFFEVEDAAVAVGVREIVLDIGADGGVDGLQAGFVCSWRGGRRLVDRRLCGI
jgi:hypothetical protein